MAAVPPRTGSFSEQLICDLVIVALLRPTSDSNANPSSHRHTISEFLESRVGQLCSTPHGRENDRANKQTVDEQTDKKKRRTPKPRQKRLARIHYESLFHEKMTLGDPDGDEPHSEKLLNSV
jgi:hypothetical protein